MCVVRARGRTAIQRSTCEEEVKSFSLTRRPARDPQRVRKTSVEALDARVAERQVQQREEDVDDEVDAEKHRVKAGSRQGDHGMEGVSEIGRAFTLNAKALDACSKRRPPAAVSRGRVAVAGEQGGAARVGGGIVGCACWERRREGGSAWGRGRRVRVAEARGERRAAVGAIAAVALTGAAEGRAYAVHFFGRGLSAAACSRVCDRHAAGDRGR